MIEENINYKIIKLIKSSDICKENEKLKNFLVMLIKNKKKKINKIIKK